jgi:hypothetical protein
MRAGWWLFECLQERVLCRLVHPVGALDERNASTPFNGEEGEAGGECADRVDPNLIRSPCWRDHDEVGMAPRSDQATRSAGATWPAVDWLDTHERGNGVTGECACARTTRPNNQQGVRWCVGEQRGEMRRGGIMATSCEACRATRRVSGVRRR